MKKTLTALAVAAGLLPGLAAAGPYDQPYGLIESGDRSQTRNQERVAIAKIDGKSPRDPSQRRVQEEVHAGPAGDQVIP
jgi:hypothetical protein